MAYQLEAAKERRKTPRFFPHAAKEYFIDIQEGLGVALLANLSRHGLAFQYSRPLLKGETYKLNIRCAESDKIIVCEACILWAKMNLETRHSLYGARIVRMDPSEKIDLLDALYQDWKQKNTSNL